VLSDISRSLRTVTASAVGKRLPPLSDARSRSPRAAEVRAQPKSARGRSPLATEVRVRAGIRSSRGSHVDDRTCNSGTSRYPRPLLVPLRRPRSVRGFTPAHTSRRACSAPGSGEKMAERWGARRRRTAHRCRRTTASSFTASRPALRRSCSPCSAASSRTRSA
jgi:hypothetical protein